MSITLTTRLRLCCATLLTATSLFGCQAVGATADTATPSAEGTPQNGPAQGAAWQSIAATLVERARALDIPVQTDDRHAQLSLFVDTRTAFLGDGRELTPAFAGLLAEAASLLQAEPGAHVRIAGFGDLPATRYNPVQLGLRVRRLRTYLANQGFPVRQIRAVVKDNESFNGPATLLDSAHTGRVIELRFSPR